MKDKIGGLSAPKPTCQGGSKWSPCKNPAKSLVVPRDYNGTPKGDARPMCGVHRVQNANYEERGKRYAAQRAADKERQKRVARATNVGALLQDAIEACDGPSVAFSTNHYGRELLVDVESAEKLRQWLLAERSKG